MGRNWPEWICSPSLEAGGLPEILMSSEDRARPRTGIPMQTVLADRLPAVYNMGFSVRIPLSASPNGFSNMLLADSRCERCEMVGD